MSLEEGGESGIFSPTIKLTKLCYECSLRVKQLLEYYISYKTQPYAKYMQRLDLNRRKKKTNLLLFLVCQHD